MSISYEPTDKVSYTYRETFFSGNLYKHLRKSRFHISHLDGLTNKKVSYRVASLLKIIRTCLDTRYSFEKANI